MRDRPIRRRVGVAVVFVDGCSAIYSSPRRRWCFPVDALRPARAKGDGGRRRARSRLATDPKPRREPRRVTRRELDRETAGGASTAVDSVGSGATGDEGWATEYEVRDGRPVAKPTPAGTRRYAEELQMRKVYGMG